MKKASMPTQVWVGEFPYEIIESDDGVIKCATKAGIREGDLLGLCDCRNLAIYIAEGMPLRRKQEVVWHEVSHAIQDLGGIGSETGVTGEVSIGSLATLQLMTLRKNPDLAAFLLRE